MVVGGREKNWRKRRRRGIGHGKIRKSGRVDVRAGYSQADVPRLAAGTVLFLTIPEAATAAAAAAASASAGLQGDSWPMSVRFLTRPEDRPHLRKFCRI